MGITSLLLLLWAILGFHSFASLAISVSHTSQLAAVSRSRSRPQLEWPGVAAPRSVAHGIVQEVDPGFLLALGEEQEDEEDSAPQKESWGMSAMFAEFVAGADANASAEAVPWALPALEVPNVTYSYEARNKAKRVADDGGSRQRPLRQAKAAAAAAAGVHDTSDNDGGGARTAHPATRAAGPPPTRATRGAPTRGALASPPARATRGALASPPAPAAQAAAASEKCENKGPWPCNEKGCPAEQVHCSDMKSWCSGSAAGGGGKSEGEPDSGRPPQRRRAVAPPGGAWWRPGPTPPHVRPQFSSILGSLPRPPEPASAGAPAAKASSHGAQARSLTCSSRRRPVSS